MAKRKSTGGWLCNARLLTKGSVSSNLSILCLAGSSEDQLVGFAFLMAIHYPGVVRPKLTPLDDAMVTEAGGLSYEGVVEIGSGKVGDFFFLKREVR
jgi:hypothetical protein